MIDLSTYVELDIDQGTENFWGVWEIERVGGINSASTRIHLTVRKADQIKEVYALPRHYESYLTTPLRLGSYGSIAVNVCEIGEGDELGAFIGIGNIYAEKVSILNEIGE